VPFAAFSPDEGRVLTADDPGQAVVWDVETRMPLATLAHEDRLTAAAFHPTNPDVVFTGAEKGAVRFWDVTKKEPRTAQHGGTVWGLLPDAPGAGPFSPPPPPPPPPSGPAAPPPPP